MLLFRSVLKFFEFINFLNVLNSIIDKIFSLTIEVQNTVGVFLGFVVSPPI